MFIGTPVMPQGLLTRGIAATLDAMRELAGVNTVLTFSNNVCLRQYMPGYAPVRDRESGREIADVFVETHEEFYAGTSMRQPRNPDALGGQGDIIDELAAEARPRGMQVYARILEPYVITGAVPGMEACAEVTARDETGPHVCFNHPDYVAWWDAVVTDLVQSHPDLAGFKFGQERGGPLGKALGAEGPTCFCAHCLPLASARGIDVEEARRGLLALTDFRRTFHRSAGGPAPADGYWTTYQQILTDHPAVLAWDRFWMDSREEQRRRLHRLIKRLRPDIAVGWHIDHGMSWDLLARAHWRYAEMTPHSDWLSVGLYFDCMGPRAFKHFRARYEHLLFADLDPATAYRTYLQLLGFDPAVEADYAAQLAAPRPFTPDYVRRETRRAVRGVAGRARVYPRIGFDVPLHPLSPEPDTVYAATMAALEEGADGLFVGREWDELRPENAAAFGRAVRDWQQAHPRG